MKNICYNEDSLSDKEINEIVTRVKVFLINENNEMLFASSDGGVQLIGGHVETNEEMETAVIREVKEESGITLKLEQIEKPFYEIKYYTKNYNNSGKNRISQVLYYFCKTSDTPNESDMNLTENEKNNNFNLKHISFDKVYEFVSCYLNAEKEINRNIASEILVAFKELENCYNL